MKSITVVVPVYRSEQTVYKLYQRLIATLEPLTNKLEIIFVDDDGKDGAWNIICEISQIDLRVRGLQHARNFGQHNALLTGIRAAKNEIIVTLDDDLQNPPEEIPKMLALLEQGYDVVYGTPKNEQHGFFRDIASQVTKIALKGVMGTKIARKVSTFRVFRTFLRSAFADYQNPYVCIDVLLTWGTTRFGAIQVKHEARQIGVSNYTIGKLIRHAINMMTGFSVLPLQLASLIGFLFTLLGFGLLVYVLTGYFIRGSGVAGFPFLASVIAIFSGAQMFALGIMGEYLARMHLRSMGRPTSIVRQSTRIPTDSSVSITSDL